MPLEIIQADNLSKIPSLVHGFTTRNGGVSENAYHSLNFGWSSGDEDERIEQNFEILADDVGIDPERFVGVRQVHSTHFIEIQAGSEEFLNYMTVEADGIFTRAKNTFLTVRSADCFPILMLDVKEQVIAVLHAGWRGTLENIVGKAIDILVEKFSGSAESIFMAIGPGISVKNYEIGSGLHELFKNQVSMKSGESIVQGEKCYIDLRKINFRIAVEKGLSENQIWVSQDCTFENSDKFFSYRRDGKITGRQMGFIGMKG